MRRVSSSNQGHLSTCLQPESATVPMWETYSTRNNGQVRPSRAPLTKPTWCFWCCMNWSKTIKYCSRNALNANVSLTASKCLNGDCMFYHCPQVVKSVTALKTNAMTFINPFLLTVEHREMWTLLPPLSIREARRSFCSLVRMTRRFVIVEKSNLVFHFSTDHFKFFVFLEVIPEAGGSVRKSFRLGCWWWQDQIPAHTPGVSSSKVQDHQRICLLLT